MACLRRSERCACRRWRRLSNSGSEEPPVLVISEQQVANYEWLGRFGGGRNPEIGDAGI